MLNGRLQPGDRLPASRELATTLGVSRNTVVFAFQQLLAEGYFVSRVGSGTFVAEDLPGGPLVRRATATGARSTGPPTTSGSGRAANSPRRPKPRLSAYSRRSSGMPILFDPPRLRYDFRYGRVPQDERTDRQWRRFLARAAERHAVQYAPPEGLGDLRSALGEYLRVSRGVACDEEQILVVSGSQQGLDLCARVLLDPGDSALLESPTYRGARHAFHAIGAKLIFCPVDEEGLVVDSIPKTADRAKLAYVTPSHQFPTGAVQSLRRRLALLEWANARNSYVIEDDYDSDFRYVGRPVETLFGLDTSGRTIYVGTLSKVLFPALRLGYLVLPQELVEPFRRAKWLADRHCPVLPQRALAMMFESGEFERHLRRMRLQHQSRREALLRACDEQLGDQVELVGTDAGVHVLMWLRNLRSREANSLCELAKEREVGIYSVGPHYVRPPPRAGLLMGYPNLTESAIAEGIRRLGDVLGELRPRRRSR